jgi:hypothetical protein
LPAALGGAALLGALVWIVTVAGLPLRRWISLNAIAIPA